jgi:hypothetical protein
LVRTANRWLRPAEPTAARLAIAAAAVFTGVVTVTGLLLAPHWPPTAYWGLWTPELGHLDWYRGQVQEVRIGSLMAPSGPLPNQEEIHVALQRGDPIRIRAVAGPPVRNLAALFAVYDERQHEIILLGPEAGDLVFRYRARALVIGLDQPDLRLRGALDGTLPGDSLVVEYRWTADGVCLAVTGRSSACGLGFTPGRGWSLLQYEGRIPEWLLAGLDAAWVLAFTLPVGYWRSRRRDSVIAGGLVAFALLVMPPLVGLHTATVWELLAAVVAVYAGRRVRVRVTGRDGKRR